MLKSMSDGNYWNVGFLCYILTEAGIISKEHNIILDMELCVFFKLGLLSNYIATTSNNHPEQAFHW